MDAVTLIVTALGAGAGSAVQDGACEAVQDAGARLKALVSLVDEAGSRSGRYVVTVRESQGVQVGDRNVQTNIFRPGLG